MRRVVSALVLCALAFPAGTAGAGSEPRAVEAFVNLVLGACMADKAGTSLVPDAIDPRMVGVPVEASNRDPRLGPGTLRIPVSNGAVYHERDDVTCHVYADGIDAAAALADVQAALKSAGVPVMAFSDGVIDDAAGVGRRTAVYGVMVSPTAPTLPLLTLSYPVDQPVLMTAAIRAARAD